MNRLLKNNAVELTGEIVSEFKYSHKCVEETFYETALKVQRTSGNFDVVPIIVPNRLVAVYTKRKNKGSFATIEGQFRSYNKHIDGKSKHELFVFATKFSFLEETDGINQIHLYGFICKEPVFRKTPLGREISEVLLAVDRAYGKSDYIPCIIWGIDARYISSFGVGTRISLEGRIQSREYLKRYDDGALETRTAYEVSVRIMQVVEEREKICWNQM